jgi:hypothetical protein
VLAGNPRKPTYDANCAAACQSIMEAGRSSLFSDKHKLHRRGNFPAANVGITHGKGTTEPISLNNGPLNKTLNGLISGAGLEDVAFYQSGEHVSLSSAELRPYPSIRRGF